MFLHCDTDYEPSEANAGYHQCHLSWENVWEWGWHCWSWIWAICEWLQNTTIPCIDMLGMLSHLVIPSHSKDANYRIHIIATYAVHARPLLCEVAPPTDESIHEACLQFSSLNVLPTGQQTGTSLPSSPAPYLWVVCSGVVASWGPEFTLHCTGEGECVEQIPRFSPVWFH